MQKEGRGGFPAESFRRNVLEPVFDNFKKYFYHQMMKINYAHTVMLTEEGIIGRSEAGAIIRGLKEIEAEIDPGGIKYTGEFEDIFFYLENRLIVKIGIDTAGKLHTGRSRNDLDITIYKMKLKEMLISFLEELIELTESLLEIAQLNKETIIIGYTHGQPAQPTTYGHYLGALIELLLRDLQRIFAAFRTADRCSMGAAAITTSGFNLNRRRVAELLGFSKVQENSYGSIAAADYLLEIYSALKILFINLGRFIQDLGQMTGFDLSYLHVPDEYVQISSIMPQKRNPVPVEHLRVMASITLGYCDAVVTSLHNTPFTDINDSEDPLQVVGFQAFSQGGRVLSLLKAFLNGLRVNEAVVREHIDKSYVTMTELADTMVRREGISFRQAHKISSILAGALSRERKKMSELDYCLYAEIFLEITGRNPVLSAIDLEKVLEPGYFIGIREMYGGPGLTALQNSLTTYRSETADCRKKLEDISLILSGSAKELEESLKLYLRE